MRYNEKLKKKGVTPVKLQEEFGLSLRWAQYIMAGKANMTLDLARKLKDTYKLAAKDFF